MVADTEILVSGTWRSIVQPEVRVSGTWRDVQEIEKRVSGNWQTVYLAVPPVSWSLSGLSGTYADYAPLTQTYSVGIFFQTDETVDIFRDIASNLLNEVNPYVDPPTATWVRCTHNFGDDMTSGNSRGTWHPLTSAVNFTMTYSTSGGEDSITGDFDFELSSDSSGSPIVATASSITILVGESA